jgi:hypothetical protein
MTNQTGEKRRKSMINKAFEPWAEIVDNFVEKLLPMHPSA